MNIHLPNQPQEFENELKTVVNAVKSCQTEISFLQHFISLIQALRGHIITADGFKTLEEESEERKEIFRKKSLEVLEAEWLFLWRKHPQLVRRKMLVQMKQFFTKGNIQSSQMPFNHICLSFKKFKAKFKCNDCSKIFSQFFEQHNQLRIEGAPKLYSEYIQTAVELDPVYFWDRLCLLERIYQHSSDPSGFHQYSIKGKWEEKKHLYWKRAEESSLQFILGLAQKYLWTKFEKDQIASIEDLISHPFDLACKFSRTQCENYLDRLLIYIHSILPKQTDNGAREISAEFAKQLTVPQQKKDELIKQANKFWEKHPNGSYNEGYDYYINHCRYFKPCSRPEWERKVRKLKLDPRSPKEKVRGNSKKGC